MNLEIARAIEAASSGRTGPPTCSAITRALKRRLTFEIFQPIEIWASHSSLVPRLPARALEELDFRRTNLNGYHGPFDIGRWVPDSPTIEVNGVRFGTDKLSHFASSGWRSRGRYLAARRRGLSEQDARVAAVRWGVFEERSVTGMLTDGVFSRADLAADYQGMRFYLELCQGPDALLALAGGTWHSRRPFDWSEFVTPEWDESYQVSLYVTTRWSKVRPALLGYCERRRDPDVLQRLERYRLADRHTPVEEVVEGLVRAGKLPDPGRFTLDANCPAVTAAPPDAVAPAPSAPPAGDQRSLIQEMEERERDTARRVYTLLGARLAFPGRLTGSLGWLITRTPAELDCHTVCDLRGTFVQVEPGLAAGRLSAGYTRAFAETGRHKRFLAHTYLALAIKASLLRTWERGPLGASGLTFLGVEGQLTITRVTFALGLLRHVAGSEPRRTWAVSTGLGLGF